MFKKRVLIAFIAIFINSQQIEAIEPFTMAAIGAFGAMVASEYLSVYQVNKERKNERNLGEYYRNLLYRAAPSYEYSSKLEKYWTTRKLNTVHALIEQNDLIRYQTNEPLIQFFANAVSRKDVNDAKFSLSKMENKADIKEGLIASLIVSNKESNDTTNRLNFLEKIGVSKDTVLKNINLRDFSLQSLPALVAYGIKPTGRDVSDACVDRRIKADVLDFYLKQDPSLANTKGNYSNLFGDVTLYCDYMHRDGGDEMVEEARKKIAVLDKFNTPISEEDMSVSEAIQGYRACKTLRDDFRQIMAKRAEVMGTEHLK